MKSISRPLAYAVKGRAYSSQVAAKQVPRGFNPLPQDVKVTRLPNGTVVASLEDYSPVSRVSVLYNAGPRHEATDSLGITHCLRSASTLSTQKSSGFSIAKNIQQIGGSLTCTTNREVVMYSVESLRNQLPTALEYLSSVSTAPVFKPWELTELVPRLKLDLEVYHSSLHARLVEGLHRAAYRDTLGQSIYMNADRIGSFKPQDLEDFVKSHYVSHNMAIVGLGVDHDVLVQQARKITAQKGDAPEIKKSKYHSGGESRVDVKGSLLHAAIVTEGFSFGSLDMLALSALQLALGSGPSVKYSTNLASSKIAKAASAATSQPFAASSFHSVYSDSGLFGFQVVTNGKDAGKVLKAIVSVMAQATKGGITEEDVQRAKRQMKVQMHIHAESPTNTLEWIGIEALLSGQAVTNSQIESAIDKLTLDDVTRVAKKVLTGKPTMAAVGDLSKTPYLDELMH